MPKTVNTMMMHSTQEVEISRQETTARVMMEEAV